MGILYARKSFGTAWPHMYHTDLVTSLKRFIIAAAIVAPIMIVFVWKFEVAFWLQILIKAIAFLALGFIGWGIIDHVYLRFGYLNQQMREGGKNSDYGPKEKLTSSKKKQ